MGIVIVSKKKSVLLRCDQGGCKRKSRRYKSLAEARSATRKQGWFISRRRDFQVTCPGCCKKIYKLLGFE